MKFYVMAIERTVHKPSESKSFSSLVKVFKPNVELGTYEQVDEYDLDKYIQAGYDGGLYAIIDKHLPIDDSILNKNKGQYGDFTGVGMSLNEAHNMYVDFMKKAKEAVSRETKPLNDEERNVTETETNTPHLSAESKTTKEDK